jgi:catechol 2,3-dioxygenase-like lactoylglutathione lyase family enzyme
MKVNLDHIVLNVRDVERALRFYTEVIGLPPERLEKYRAGEVPFPSLRINEDSIIDLLPPEIWGGGEPGDTRTNVDHFCLAVDAASWPALEGRLKRAGVEYELGPITLSGAHGDGTAVYVRDSEGNRLELRYY